MAPTENAGKPALPPTDDTLILTPVRDTVLLPGAMTPLAATLETTAAGLQEAARTEQHVVVVLQRDSAVDAPGLADLQTIGTEARLLRYMTGRDGTHHAIMQGLGRVRLLALVEGSSYARVTVARITEPTGGGAEIDARFHQLRERALEALGLMDQAAP
jgi:ATP-dependent Lon protease